MTDKEINDWHPRVTRLRNKLDDFIDAANAYRKEIESEALKHKLKNPKVYAVLAWQIEITNELLEQLETEVTESVIRIAEQDLIINDPSVGDILV